VNQHLWLHRFVPHFHIPIQSGCNQILELMSRRYRRELFDSRVRTIKLMMPLACIGVDVIVGFPGETDALFEETYSFLDRLDISYLHVFSYSERRNTKAVLLPGKVSSSEKEIRSHRLIELSEKKRLNFYQQNLGTDSEVLFEAQVLKGKMTGFTPNYIRVETAFHEPMVNKSIKVKLTELQPSGNVDIIFTNL